MRRKEAVFVLCLFVLTLMIACNPHALRALREMGFREPGESAVMRNFDPYPMCSPRARWQFGGSRHGHVFAVIVGLENYGGGEDRIRDAGRPLRELKRKLLQHGVAEQNLVFLLNEEATHRGVLDAIYRVAAQAEREDFFLFYVLAHGGRVFRVVGEPRSFIRFYDRTMFAEELTWLLNQVHAQQLVMVESGGSGGFASLTDQSHLTRAVILSSRDNEATGLVMTRFLANVGLDMADWDGVMTARDLARWVRNAYVRAGVSERQHVVFSGHDFPLWQDRRDR